ncbi:helix-turn-helix domain-containing protein [Streptomyces sp. NPDC006333]|uniref:helix-turn-helix domain-containing protein n=1 Tax=Streptomyces sp. NPDC006333 TaxID=3156753 RepID=UPI0033B0C9B3
MDLAAEIQRQLLPAQSIVLGSDSVRTQAAEWLEQDLKPSEVARRLRVSVKSAYHWHQLWRDGWS